MSGISIPSGCGRSNSKKAQRQKTQNAKQSTDTKSTNEYVEIASFVFLCFECCVLFGLRALGFVFLNILS
jgi:hypothetical protein